MHLLVLGFPIYLSMGSNGFLLECITLYGIETDEEAKCCDIKALQKEIFVCSYSVLSVLC